MIRKNLFLTVVRYLLIPFSIIYSIIIFFRNKFYDLGIFRSEKLSKPVISVGNITTGGTGKTPFTILIAEHFMNKGLKTGIVARGYKRDSKETVIVSDGVSINKNVEESGDELILIADELSKNHKNEFSIAAGSDRIAASKLLIDKFNPDIIILDDAFQHRRIKRDLDLVMIDARNFLNERFMNAFTLPSGILRESFFNLGRADITIQNNKDKDLKIIPRLELYGKKICLLRYKTEYFMDNKNSILNNYDTDAIVFSGIADDSSFISMVSSSGLKIKKIVKYSDHFVYTESDINSLIKKYEKGNIFITTEKDFVKIRGFEKFISEYPVYYLKIKTEVTGNESILYNKLDELIK